MTVGDVAAVFGVTAQAVRDWADQGKLPSFRTPGGHYRFHRSDVEEFLAESGATS